ncbi:hypothetical protein HDV01_005131 [Terramyces sp. JEL0728]|nr:hypothetical protein HDV01_005131 [Terramyces sp. JEL0728]
MVDYDPQEQELVKRIDSKVLPILAVIICHVSLNRLINLHTISPLYEYAGVDEFFKDEAHNLMNTYLNIAGAISLIALAVDNSPSDTFRICQTALVMGIEYNVSPMVVSLISLGDSANRSIVSFFMSVISIFLLWLLHRQTQKQEITWGPGLRRLLNDADEAKAWDDGFEMELTDMDFKKSGRLEGWTSNDELGGI